jgi:hypothetical protein
MPRQFPASILSRSCLIAALIVAAGNGRSASAVDSVSRVGKSASAGFDRDDELAKQAVTSTRRIEKLIDELGHPRFTVRRAAANELRRIGPEAFDLLHAATAHTDPEVAASARYLLRQCGGCSTITAI